MITSTDRNGVDKVSRYKWMSKNEPGDLEYVPKKALRIDHEYQRPLNDRKRIRIASEFNYAAFGVLVCSRRPDGSVWVIDGQHRLAAAMTRGDVDTVPCIIFDLGGSVSEEAKDFLATNKERKPLTGFETFRAMLKSGDPSARAVQEVVESTGNKIADNDIRCVSALYKCMSSDEASFRRVWPLIVTLCAGEPPDNRLVLGMHWAESKLRDMDGNHCSLLDPKNMQKILDAGLKAIMRAIGDASAYYNRGGAHVFADGILNVINHKRHKKLVLKGAPRKVEEA
jgi:hypothetical protein